MSKISNPKNLSNAEMVDYFNELITSLEDNFKQVEEKIIDIEKRLEKIEAMKPRVKKLVIEVDNVEQQK